MGFDYQKDDQNIVTIIMDMPGRSANVINAEFHALMDGVLEKLKNDNTVAGVILTSAKKTFLAGGDLEMLFALEDPQEVYNSSQRLKDNLRTVETRGIPIVAAINGSALGGGLELALACHYRIAIDDPRIKIGLPEVTFGLLPGGGGVARLPRIIGLEAALPFLLEGKPVKPSVAKTVSIIDDLASDKDDLIQKAKAWILAHPESAQPWDLKGYKMPGGTPQHPKVAQMLAIAPAILKKKTQGNYPAPEAIMNTTVEGALVDFDTAVRIETRYFIELATGKVAKNMINAFWFQMNKIKSGASRPKDIIPVDTQKVGVLGAGMMGHGIAYVTALSRMEVVMADATQVNADKGLEKIANIMQKKVDKGRMAQEKMDDVLSRIIATDDYSKLGGCDLIIEAVFEDRDLKAKVTDRAELAMDPSGVFASNTSTLPITGLAEKSSRPENFIGIHFFSPVHKMNLVEIIVGEKTSDQALAKAFDYVLKIRKTPIVVNDSRGFYTSRVFGTYPHEGMALLAEGHHPQEIESAGKKAGMPVGPLAVSDEVSLVLMVHIRDQSRKDLEAEGKTLPESPGDQVLDVMTQKVKRLGRSGGGGFYEYDGRNKHLWPGLAEHFPLCENPLSQEEMIERMMFVQSIETVRCYEENVLTSVADANIGSILGWGFAPFKGGTLQYINDYGVEAFVARSQELAHKYGPRFAPPKLLLDMAEKDRSFN
ncbi:enoyl-CoA hydratase/isomerase family protein [Caldithrix abyssi]|nr:enoyl-CoA hydratase/isomerase family protein [Caldithrix abyssi]